MPALSEGEGDAPGLRREQLAALLASHGRLFSDELGIRLEGRDPGEVFRWFLASLLFGARIVGSVAVRTYRAFEAHRLVTPESIAAADFGELLQIMAEGGYVRYDGITSRKVQGARPESSWRSTAATSIACTSWRRARRT